ncbi:ATP-binding protein [Roseovarius sp. ZX-A-9]|uniref:ATP-binding protein n=1 Tax=Roseovarius sp. ZX-A-9 TaxID=3014783 RepID=UPI00232E4EBC|nr:ATP-binding protein [Roseovarius sp. ZX-A-9]
MEMTAQQPPLAAGDLRRAALAGVFDPRALIPQNAENAEERLAALAALANEREMDGRWYWALTPDARRAGLALLPTDEAARTATLAAAPRLEGDALGAALRAALSAKPGADLRALLHRGSNHTGGIAQKKGLDPNTLGQALELLEEAGVPLPAWAADPATVRGLRRAVVLDRRARAAHRLLPTPFRGRGRELKALMNYVRNGDAVDHASRPVMETLRADPESGDIRAVVVSGIGGTGKSALIEALRRKAERAKDMTFLAFDLDQTSLRSGERVALTMELLRQIGLLHPQLDHPLSALRGMLRDMLSSVTDDGALLEMASSAVYSALSELGTHLETAGVKSHGFALVFDTFEQALVAGEARVRLIADWLMLLRDIAGIENLRVILSGREADMIVGRDFPGLTIVAHIELGDLGTNSGRAKLRDTFRRFKIDHLDLVPDLIAAFGSNPLVIEIVATFCRNRPRSEIVTLAEDGDDGLRAELGTEMRQRILYTRILHRIADPELRPLASPGLVLRRITPELIEEVLAGPCGLPQPLPPGQADALYEALAGQVWLVRPALSGDALEHVPDLRRLMLPQILALPAAEDVARTAARWYEDAAAGQPGPDMWESLYYRCLVDPGALDGLATPDLLAIADHLGAAAEDLAPHVQALLREASGSVLTRAEIDTLTGEARNRATQKRRAQQVSEGLEQTVLSELAEDAQAMTAPDSAARFASYLSDDGELAQSEFAAAAFDRLADAAPHLACALWAQVAAQAPIEKRDFNLSHPAWLASIATLMPDKRGGLARAARNWAETEGRDGGAATLLEALDRSAGQDRARARLAMMTMAIASAPHAPAAALEPALGREALLPATTGQIETALDWRYQILMSQRQRQGKRQPGRLVPPDLYDFPANELPMLHPALLDPALRKWMIFPEPTKGQPGLEQAGLERFGTAQNLKLSEITRALTVLDRVRVQLPLEDLPQAAFDAVVPGRLPEFHAPLRLLMDGTAPGPELAQAVATTTRQLPWWPKDISPDLFARKTLGPTLIGTLIDLLDRTGLLPELARELAAMNGPDSRAAQISDLIDAFCSFLRGSND